MKTVKLWLMMAVLLSTLGGCMTAQVAWPYSGLASHTLRTSPDRDQDVLWLQYVDGKVYRCTETTEGPTCVAVKRQ